MKDILSLFTAVMLEPQPADAPSSKINVVVIFADDVGYGEDTCLDKANPAK